MHQSLSPMRSEEMTHSISDDGENGGNKGVIIQTLTMPHAQLHNIPYVKAQPVRFLTCQGKQLPNG